MHWIAASLLSALFLGLYELCTKHAVHDNAVVPVLFLSTLTGAVVWGGLMLVPLFHPSLLPPALVTDSLSATQHLQLLLKSAIVAASWVFTYFAFKHLPLSLGSPIRATSPLWTLMGATTLLGERPTALQIAGILTTLLSFIGLSVAGAGEGVHFHRSKWVGFLMAGTVLGAVSSLYYRYLLGRAHFRVPTVQAWFMFYLVVFFLPLMVGWRWRWWARNQFEWRWSVPCIALSLLVADYIYFAAVRSPDALISIVMSLRRGSALVGFAGGLFFFREKFGWRKLAAVMGIRAGIALM
ncbi:MAG: EamA family transporter, partial [Limisphaerales bacterium]